MLNRNFKKNKCKTLSEKVDEIIQQEQNEFSDGSSTELPGLVDYDEDNYELPTPRSSEIRKRNIKMLSEQNKKYKGKIVSRKDIENELLGGCKKKTVRSNGSGENSDDDSEDDAEMCVGGSQDDDDASKNSDAESENSDVDDENNDAVGENCGVNSGDGSSENESSNSSASDDTEDENAVNKRHGPNIFPASNKQNEKEKADCVQNQLKIWERLLDLRIQSQNLLNKANLLPEPEAFKQTKQQNNDFSKLPNELETGLTKLLNYLITLQSTLYGQFSEIKTAFKNDPQLLRANKKSSSSLNSKVLAQHLAHNFSVFKPYRNSVLLKWDDRTKLLTPGAKPQKKSLNEDYDVIRKIDNALLNRNQMIKKSQTRKSGSSSAETDVKIRINPNIYDDTDFYHHQLREFIECKTNSSSTKNDEITIQLKELQKLRQKMKKKVDTRASKGRKIRYTIHKKLINFMAPNDSSNWSVDSQNELYKSLFA